jgi:hypothetical protein
MRLPGTSENELDVTAKSQDVVGRKPSPPSYVPFG